MSEIQASTWERSRTSTIRVRILTEGVTARRADTAAASPVELASAKERMPPRWATRLAVERPIPDAAPVELQAQHIMRPLGLQVQGSPVIAVTLPLK